MIKVLKKSRSLVVQKWGPNVARLDLVNNYECMKLSFKFRCASKRTRLQIATSNTAGGANAAYIRCSH